MISRRGALKVGVLLGLGLFALLCLRAAWLSDDSYITLRVLDNALGGHGLRWNVSERVQAYTHPLWLLVLAIPYALTRETLWTVSCLGIALTLLALGIATRRLDWREQPLRALVFLGLLALSRSVVSYATSGLENPLGLLLMVVLVQRCLPAPEPRTACSRREATGTVLLTSLLVLTRVDLLLMAGPLVLSRLRRARARDAGLALVLGGLPVVAWELFSLVYYGMFVPNTALAKLGSGVGHGALALQGLRYFASLGLWDPLGAALLALGVVVGLQGRSRALALGLLAYGVYLVWIGGDFMCGRFFSIPIVLAALTLFESPRPCARPAWLLLLPSLLIFSDDVGPLRWLRAQDPFWTRWGIVDERVFYVPLTGLLEPTRPRDPGEQSWAREALTLRDRKVAIVPAIGMVGYYAGPTVHIIDPMALADPLLARLPVDDPSEFRIGHFMRTVPEGYVASLRRARNLIVDRELARYWDAVWVVTHGPVFTMQRARAVVELMSGRLDPLRDAYVARQRAARPQR